MAQSFPLSLPPADNIREMGAFLDAGTPRTILDIGSGVGRNSIYLAQLGHVVVGLNNDPSEVAAAQQVAADAGIDANCRFIEGDVRDLPALGLFDIVLVNEVTHLFAPTVSAAILAGARSHTKQGGLNVVSGYLVRPGEANVRNTERCFKPEQLLEIYRRAGWLVLAYDEEYQPNQMAGNREIIFSRAKLIAQRPWLASTVRVPTQRGRW